jgi:hypothetical protein
MTVEMSLEEIRQAARLAKYDNRIEEDENIARVDREVWDRVQVFEEAVVGAARAHVDKFSAMPARADSVETEIRRTIRFAAESGEEVDSAFALKFENLRREAERLANSLEIAERDAAFHIDRCQDVYGTYQRFIAKWPELTRKRISVR